MGGLSLGFALALKSAEIAGLDIDEVAVETYNLNLNRFNARAYVQDVLGWEPSGDYEIVIGGSPCQPFSVANNKNPGEKHPLFPTLPKFFDIVIELKPSVFILENVKGLTMRKHRGLLERELARVAPDYAVEWRVLNAADYGVPQRRVRLIVIGVRRDLGRTPAFPEPTHVARWLTLGEAVCDLLTLPLTTIPDHVLTEKGGWANPSSDWGSRVMDLGKPAYTITEKHRSGQLVPIPQIGNGYCRRLTVRECMRLQSFPDWWRFPDHVSISKKYKLVGEAVPPILAYRLALAVARLLGLETREPPREEEWQLPYFKRAFADYLDKKD
jgi:DNA (cytosine-5)-methyltransferase 1